VMVLVVYAEFHMVDSVATTTMMSVGLVAA
jgi:hypothetical protein